MRAAMLGALLMAVLPTYALTVYDSDDTTPLFTVSTDPAHAQPYLKAPESFPEQEVDFAKGAASIGQMGVEVVDVPQTPGDQTTGYLTGLLADASGNSQVNGHRALVTQDIGAGAEPVMDGVVSNVELLDTFVTYRLELKDIRERERKTKAFTNTTTNTLLPRGVLDGYGVTVPVLATSRLYPIPATVPLVATYHAVDANQGRFSIDNLFDDRLILDEAMREAIESVKPIDGEPETYVFDKWRIRWRAAGTSDPWNLVEQVQHSGSSYAPVPYTLRGGKVLDVYANNFVSGDTLPSDLQSVEFVVQYIGPLTEEWPLHLQDETVGSLLADLYDGVHSTEDPRIRYNAAAVAALTTPVRLILKEPVDDLREWAEKNLYPIAFAAPTLNAAGEIAPITYLLPDSSVTPTELDDDNCAPAGGGWSHGSQDAVNVVKVSYKRDFGVDGQAFERKVTIEHRIQASIDLLGEQELEIESEALRALGTLKGLPIVGDHTDEVGAQVAAQITRMVTDRFVLGGQYFRLKAMRTDSDVEALQPGSWCTALVSWMPDYLLDVRGLSRLAQVVSRRNIDAAWCMLTLIDAGSANAPVTAPTLGTVTADATGVVSIPVTALGSGAEARVDYAVNATEPAAGSELWRFLGRVDSVPDTLTTPPIAPGATAWVRARGEALGRRPSGWTTAVSVTAAGTPRVLGVSVELDEFGVPTVYWSPNANCLGVRLYYDVHLDGELPSFSTLDADASDVEHEFPTIRVPQGYVFTCQVEPYTGWTGAAVSGTAGPKVEVRAVGVLIARPPVVAMQVSQSGSTGSLDLAIEDPDLLVTSIQFAEKADAGAYGALASTWDRSSGTAGTSAQLTRGEDIALAEKHVVSIRYVVTYNDGSGAKTIEGAHTFDADLIAEITGCTITFDANGNAIVAVQGDEDCDAIFITVGDGATPADPTAGTNDGSVTSRNGTITTTKKITTGNAAVVKVVGGDDIGGGSYTLGPVRTFRQDRRIGPVHQDASSRAVTGTLTETTLETITIPANQLGSNGAYRLTFQVLLNIPQGDGRIRVRLNGTSVATVLFAAVASVRVQGEIILHNDGATNDQRVISSWIASDGTIELGVADQAEDSTSDLTLTITGDLGDVDDSITLATSLGELLGTV